MNFTVPATSLRIITLVVVAIAINVTACIGTMAYCLISRITPDTPLFTAFVGVTGALSGALTGLLVNTRTTPGTDADLPKATVTTTVSDKPVTTVTTDKPTI